MGGSDQQGGGPEGVPSLGKINATIVGVVMNNVRIPKGVYGSYYYSYYRPSGDTRKETA
jgi:hypothetical protein